MPKPQFSGLYISGLYKSAKEIPPIQLMDYYLKGDQAERREAGNEILRRLDAPDQMKKLFSVGIIVTHSYRGNEKDGWWASIEFQDTQVCTAGSIEGKISTRYGSALPFAIDTILKQAQSFGIEFFDKIPSCPKVSYLNDGETTDYPPPDGWTELLEIENDRLGWSPTSE